MRDARSKADAVAAAAGLHVTGVVSVNETQQQVYSDYGRLAAAAAPQALRSEVVPVRHGTQKVTAAGDGGLLVRELIESSGSARRGTGAEWMIDVVVWP